MKKIACLQDVAKLDIGRIHRCAIPEFILAADKSPELVYNLLVKMAHKAGISAATKVNPAHRAFIEKQKPGGLTFDCYERAQIVVLKKKKFKIKLLRRKIAVLTAGSSDISVAEEARVTANLLGCPVIYDYDVGVAGMHRLINPLKKMLKERVACCIVVAGMDGVLPVLVKSLVDIPVIGVPTSRGYGFGGKGEAALRTMLQSCSPGLVTVNIDNGFGAACAAYLIARQSK
ncbi:MAG: nickel pincer cofactor biosynthesis protein LarB [Candidatus Omnitrophota bacterium]